MKNTIIRVWHASLLAVAALLMVIALVAGLSAAWGAISNVESLSKSYEVVNEAHRALEFMRDADVEVQGFINTGGAAYRDAFASTVAAMELSLKRLRELVADNQRQLKRATELEALMARRIADLRHAFELRREESDAATARNFLMSESALHRMMEVRQTQREIEAEEITLLEQRRGRMHDNMKVSVFTVVITGGLSLALAVNSFLLMRRALGALKREAELLRAKEQAERSDREKSEFLANMSHEIRTPMNAVLGFAELLSSIVTSPKQRQYVEAINTSGRALLAMINDILDLSKIEAGRLDLALRPVSLRGVFHGISTVFEQQASERGLKLDFSVEPSVPPSIVFDALRLRQILFNVVGNALKFTARGSVRVKAWSFLTEGDETTLTLHMSVTDTGIGIAAENIDVIFEPFRQVTTSKHPAHGGTGLGLSITKRLTEMLNGRITVDSTPGEGTTFFFEFKNVPISAALPEEERVASPDEDLDRLRPSLILVADDVALNRDLLSGYFEGTRHRLLFASGGREAVEIAEKFRPDLVLMDIRMPDVDGREARELIRAIPELATTPMVAVTASTLLVEEQNLRKVFEGYVRKPFTRAALYGELAKLLPQEALPGSSEPMVVPEFVDTHEADPRLWKDFLEELRRIETDTWPRLAQSMGMRESEAFAQDLGQAAQRVGCGPAREYAKKLAEEVQAFDIQAQEKTMKAFPQLVRQIARVVEGGDA
jgi:signal transduction histidine kinase/CheY-like chemotaxis protein